MPARGKIGILNNSGGDKKKLIIKYSGNLDDVTCEQFENVSWGDGLIELSNGEVKDKVGKAEIAWHDRQGRGPAWKRVEWMDDKASYGSCVGEGPTEMELPAGTFPK